METREKGIQSGYQVQGRIWLEGVEGTFLGHGRVLLLARIKAYGSISQAAKSMKMSFKHAKDLLDSMNRQAGCALVLSARGGESGGGTALTPAGEKAINLFYYYHARFQEVLQEMNNELSEFLPQEEFYP